MTRLVPKALRGRVSGADRVQRLVMGLLLLTLNLIGLLSHPEPLRWVALGIQLELIGTALVGWCPLYWVSGTTSCRIDVSPGGDDGGGA